MEKENNIKIKFEGDYLNGKKWNGKIYDYYGIKVYGLKNGKGKIREYYDNGKFKFEGEYLNGLRNGKGAEYFKNGKLKCEGKYLNGRIWNGIEYNYGENLIFEVDI
jgi:antitoxin component YwqK of YwqJK toxin-antitoxin module